MSGNLIALLVIIVLGGGLSALCILYGRKWEKEDNLEREKKNNEAKIQKLQEVQAKPRPDDGALLDSLRGK